MRMIIVLPAVSYQFRGVKIKPAARNTVSQIATSSLAASQSTGVQGAATTPAVLHRVATHRTANQANTTFSTQKINDPPWNHYSLPSTYPPLNSSAGKYSLSWGQQNKGLFFRVTKDDFV